MDTNYDFSSISAGRRKQFGSSKIRKCRVGRWIGNKHNAGNCPNMLAPISGDSPHKDSQLQEAGGTGLRPTPWSNLSSSSPLCTCYVQTHYRSVGYYMEFTGIRDCPATSPQHTNSKHLLWMISGLFLNLTLHQGCTVLKKKSRNEKKKKREREREKSILNSTERCLFTTPHRKRSNFSSPVQPSPRPPLPLVPLGSTSQGHSPAH